MDGKADYTCPSKRTGGYGMEPRYERNIPSVSPEEQEALSHKKVLIVGCGGLGG